MPHVACFANMKGGVGKTTLCVNLGFELFLSMKKVLIIDNDPQFNATSALVKPQKYLTQCISDEGAFQTIYDVYEKAPRIAGGGPKRNESKRSFVPTWSMKSNPAIRLDIVASRIELYETLRNPAHKEYLLDKFITSYANDYDYVLIDCPPTPSVLTLSAFAASDSVVIPTSPDYFSTFGLAQFLGTLLDFKQDLHDAHDIRPLGLAFTKVPRRSSPELVESMTRVQTTLKELTEDVDVPIFTSHISQFKVYEKALWQSVPVQRLSGVGTRGKTQSAMELKALRIEFEDRVTALRSCKT